MPELLDSTDVAGLFEGLGGRAATYTPYGGAAASCTVLLDPGSIEVRSEGGELVAQHDEITFNRDEVSEPTKDAIVVIASVGTWRLVGQSYRDDSESRWQAVQTA